MADPAVNKEVEVATSEARKLTEQARSIKIRTEDDAKAATAKLVEIKRVAKNIESRRRTITQPLNLAIKEVNSLFKEPAQFLSDAEKAIKDAMLVYGERQKQRAEKRAAKLQGQIDSGELDAAKGADKLASVKDAPKSVSTADGQAQWKTVTKVRIINAAELPAEYFLRDRVIDALRIEVENDVRTGRALPSGAEQYEDKQLAVRA
jgi:hypothetical protein